jgi:hypothetical protein
MAPFDPPTYSETTGTTYKFNTGADNFNDSTRDFLGYEVYYKIGLTTDAFKDDISLVNPADLAAHNFQRLHFFSFSSTPGQGQDTWAPTLNLATLPLIKTNHGAVSTSDTITISFSTISGSYPNILLTASSSLPNPPGFDPIELRRSVPINNSTSHPEYGYYKKFSEFMPGDVDSSQIQGVFTGGLQRLETFQVYIAIYVYAYGKSIETSSMWRDITSSLLYLGANQITVYYYDGL